MSPLRTEREVDAHRPARETGNSGRPLPSIRSLPPPPRPPAPACAPTASRAYEQRDPSRGRRLQAGPGRCCGSGTWWLDTLIGWAPKIGVPQVRSALVVVERGWLDLAVDPARYRLSSSSAVTRFLGRFLPKPSMVMGAEAPAAVLTGRKPELDETEITRQFEAWRDQRDSNPSRFVLIDASRSQEAVFEQALDSIDDRLASRQHDLQSSELALAGLGDLRVAGKPYRIISAPRGPTMRGPRWVLPSGMGCAGTARGTALPPRASPAARARARARARATPGPSAGRHTCSHGAGAGRRAHDRRQARDRPCSSSAPRRARVATLRGPRAAQRRRASRAAGGFRRKVARVRLPGHRVQVGGSSWRRWIVPGVIDFFEWRDCAILLLKPFHVRDRANRPLGTAELTGLSELARLSSALAPVPRRASGAHSRPRRLRTLELGHRARRSARPLGLGGDEAGLAARGYFPLAHPALPPRRRGDARADRRGCDRPRAGDGRGLAPVGRRRPERAGSLAALPRAHARDRAARRVPRSRRGAEARARAARGGRLVTGSLRCGGRLRPHAPPCRRTSRAPSRRPP